MISLRSKITRKLLNYFFLNPQDNLYINEICKKIRVDKRNLVKKLKELEKKGVLESEEKGNLKLYSIDKNYPLYDEYKKIVLKTIGLEKRLKEILNEVEGIKKAYIYGSYAQDKMDVYSDIDLLVVGKHKILELQKRLNNFQSKIDREINTVNMDEKEFKKRANEDSFVKNILKDGNNIRLI